MNPPSVPSPPPAADASPRSDDRFAGLSATARDLLATVERSLASDISRADAALAGAVALAPHHPEVRRLRAALLNRVGQAADARTIVEECLQASPNDPLLLTELAESLLSLGENDAALATLRRVCELQPDNAIGWLNLGHNLKEHAWIEESVPPLARAVELDPANTYARTLHADVLVLLGKLVETEYSEP
jgi:predicted Zn-dependent protease